MNCLNWKLSLYSFSSKHRKRKLQSLFHSLWFPTLIFCWVWVSQKHSFHHSPTSVFLCVFFVVFFPLPNPYCIKVRGQRPRSNPSSHWTDHQAKQGQPIIHIHTYGQPRVNINIKRPSATIKLLIFFSKTRARTTLLLTQQRLYFQKVLVSWRLTKYMPQSPSYFSRMSLTNVGRCPL